MVFSRHTRQPKNHRGKWGDKDTEVMVLMGPDVSNLCVCGDFVAGVTCVSNLMMKSSKEPGKHQDHRHSAHWYFGSDRLHMLHARRCVNDMPFYSCSQRCKHIYVILYSLHFPRHSCSRYVMVHSIAIAICGRLLRPRFWLCLPAASNLCPECLRFIMLGLESKIYQVIKHLINTFWSPPKLYGCCLEPAWSVVPFLCPSWIYWLKYFLLQDLTGLCWGVQEERQATGTV